MYLYIRIHSVHIRSVVTATLAFVLLSLPLLLLLQRRRWRHRQRRWQRRLHTQNTHTQTQCKIHWIYSRSAHERESVQMCVLVFVSVWHLVLRPSIYSFIDIVSLCVSKYYVKIFVTSNSRMRSLFSSMLNVILFMNDNNNNNEKTDKLFMLRL